MKHVRWFHRPTVSAPVVVAAFEGWNDAGDAASGAVRWLIDRFEATRFADIDPEDFYDFTATRPEVRIEDGERVVDWPANEFWAGEASGAGSDVVLLHGVEPGLRWRTFCDAVVEVARAVDARMVLTLGALLAEVAHSRPVNVVATANDQRLVEELHVKPSTYEGPTGIVGVLHARLRQEDIPSASLWAAVPTYVPGSPSPKATLALIHRTATVLGHPIVATDLEIAAASYERQINELVADDEDTQAYVAALERQHDEHQDLDEVDTMGLLAEVEQFLRDQGE